MKEKILKLISSVMVKISEEIIESFPEKLVADRSRKHLTDFLKGNAINLWYVQRIAQL